MSKKPPSWGHST